MKDLNNVELVVENFDIELMTENSLAEISVDNVKLVESGNAVLYIPQDLTTEQAAQARDNIKAQGITDNNLETVNKDVVPAINELNQEIQALGDELQQYGKVDTVNEIAPDVNKNVIIDSSDIKIDKNNSESVSIKETIQVINEKDSEQDNSLVALDKKIDSISGVGGYLTAYDFGVDNPTQQQITDYALSQIPNITEPVEIFNGTRIKNAYNNHLWVLTNTPNTQPAIFEWVDNGLDTVMQATTTTLGVVKSSEADLKVKVETDGTMSVNNLETELVGKVDKVAGYSLTKNDLTDELKESYDIAVTEAHTHSNKEILDEITAPYTVEEKEKVDKIIINGDGKKALMNDGTYKDAGKVDTVNGIIPDEFKNVIIKTDDISDTDQTNKFVTDTEKEVWNAKEPPLPARPEVNEESKFLGWDGTGNKVWKEVSGTGGGGGLSTANIYLTEIASTVEGTYKQLSYDLEGTTTVRTKTVNNNTKLLDTYLFDLPIATTRLDSGTWNLNVWCRVSVAGGATRLTTEVFKRALDGTQTVLFTTNSVDINNTTYEYVEVHSEQPSFDVLETDRIGFNLYIGTTHTSSVVFDYHIGDGKGAYLNIPLALRHIQLRDLNGDTNYLHTTSAEKASWNNKAGKADNNTFTGENIFANDVQIGTAEADADLNIKGTLNINGDIIQNGSSYETHAEQVYTTSDEIILRDGAEVGLAVGEEAGLKFKKYDGTNDGSLKIDKDGIVRVGDVGEEQPLATREETPINAGVARWDNSATKFVTETPDTTPTASSTKLITSGGAKAYADTKATKLSIGRWSVPYRDAEGNGEANTSRLATVTTPLPNAILIRDAEGKATFTGGTSANQGIVKSQLDSALNEKFDKAGGTITGDTTFNANMKILGTAADRHLLTRGIGGISTDGLTADDLYINYGADFGLKFGKTGQSRLKSDGGASFAIRPTVGVEEVAFKSELNTQSFSKVYKSLSDLTGIDASSTLAQVCDAMVDNSYLNASTSGYEGLVPTGETDLNGQLEIIKVNANRVRLAWSYQNASRQPIYFATYRNNGGFLGWKRMITDSEAQTITGEKKFNLGTAKFSITSANNDFRIPLTSPSTTSEDKRFLLGIPSTNAPYTNTNTNAYMQNGALYSNSSEVVNVSDNQTIDGSKTFAKDIILDNGSNDSSVLFNINGTKKGQIRTSTGSAMVFNAGAGYIFRPLGNTPDGIVLNPNVNIRPEIDSSIDLGTANYKWKDIYVGGSVFGAQKEFTATLPNTSWTGSSAPYSKEITVSGVLATDKLDIDLDLSSSTYSNVETIQTSWSKVYRAVSGAGKITFYASEVPTIDIPLQIKVVR